MLEVIGAGNPEYSGKDWADVWANSSESKQRSEEIDQIINSRCNEKDQGSRNDDREFAMPLWAQIVIVTKRAFIAYWRTPEYVIVCQTSSPNPRYSTWLTDKHIQ